MVPPTIEGTIASCQLPWLRPTAREAGKGHPVFPTDDLILPCQLPWQQSKAGKKHTVPPTARRTHHPLPASPALLRCQGNWQGRSPLSASPAVARLREAAKQGAFLPRTAASQLGTTTVPKPTREAAVWMPLLILGGTGGHQGCNWCHHHPWGICSPQTHRLGLVRYTPLAQALQPTAVTKQQMAQYVQLEV